jgi:hypothetical protein
MWNRLKQKSAVFWDVTQIHASQLGDASNKHDCLAYSSILKTEAVSFFPETSVNLFQITLCHSPEGTMLLFIVTAVRIKYLTKFENNSDLCRIRGSPTGGYEEFYLLGYNAV